MYHVYVLKSLKNNRRYTGYTHKTPVLRLEEHNKGSNSYTKQNGPYELIYSESFATQGKLQQEKGILKQEKEEGS